MSFTEKAINYSRKSGKLVFPKKWSSTGKYNVKLCVFTEHIKSSYGQYGHLGWDSLSKINTNSLVWEIIHDQVSMTNYPGSRILDPGSSILDPGFRIQAPGSWKQGPGSWKQGPGSWKQGPGSWIRGPGSWIQGPGSWML